jgi:hypothetical protein
VVAAAAAAGPAFSLTQEERVLKAPAGKRLGNRSRKGRFATLSRLLGGKGTSAPTRRRVAFALTAFAALTALLVGSVSLATGAQPTVTIENASAVQYTTATAKGTIDPSTQETFYHFEYATEADFSNAESAGFGSVAEGAGVTPVEAELSGLQPSMTYHLRLVAEGEGEPVKKEAAATFTTKAVAKPTVSIEPVTAFTGTTATFVGHVNPNSPEPEGSTSADEQEAFLTRWQFKCTPACASEGERAVEEPSELAAGNTARAVTVQAMKLNPATSYQVRLIAGNRGGSEEAGPVTFMTPSIAPTVLSTTVSNIGPTEATLNARIRPNGASTTYHFEYLTAAEFLSDGEAFGQGTISTPESSSIGVDDEPHAVSSALSGLFEATTYVYRAVATNLSAGNPVVDGAIERLRTISVAQEASQSCPNEAIRAVQPFGLNLPDCRAYEQATTTDKGGTSPSGSLGQFAASADGDRVSYLVPAGFPGAEGSGNFPTFLSVRSGESWSTQGLLPPSGPGFTTTLLSGWNEQLTRFAVRANVTGAPGIGLYSENTDSRTFEPVAGPLAGSFFGRFELDGFTSEDPERLYFETTKQLLQEAPVGVPNLYEYDNRAPNPLSLVGILPASEGGELAPEGSFAGPYDWEHGTTETGGASAEAYLEHAISANGSRVFFTAAGSGQLYVREDATATTRVSRSQRSIPDPDGQKPAAFRAASPDGEDVLFTSCEKLTNDSTAVSTGERSCTEAGQEGQDLYSYNVATGELQDLTVDTETAEVDPLGAAVQGVLGAGFDSSDQPTVYFVANGVLAAGATPGDCRGANENIIAHCNLYSWRAGHVKFIARLSPGSQAHGNGSSGAWNWIMARETEAGIGHGKVSRVSAAGEVLLFASAEKLTSYENAGISEFYRYSAGTGRIVCVSCMPGGEAPVEAPTLESIRTTSAPVSPAPFLSRNLSSDGDRVFFESAEALVPGDTDGVKDVYEWEASGSGTCNPTRTSFVPQSGGCLTLISSGRSPDPSSFLDASSNGDDAFFFTSQPLVSADKDSLVDVYDARVEGGIPAQNAAAVEPCSAAACRGSGQPGPEGAAAGTARFSGPGNAKAGSGDKLRKAIALCRKKKPRRARRACETKAKRRYGSGKRSQPASTKHDGKVR